MGCRMVYELSLINAVFKKKKKRIINSEGYKGIAGGSGAGPAAHNLNCAIEKVTGQ